MNKKIILSIMLVFVLAILGACGDKKDPNSKELTDGDKGKENESLQLPEPDLKNIPKVVAEINGTEISQEDFEATYKSEFQGLAFQAMMSGQEINQDTFKKQIVERMINQELLIQAANSENIEATDKDVDEFLTTFAKDNGFESKDKLLETLKEDTNEEELIKVIKNQIKVDQLLDLKISDIEPSDAEIKELYDELVAQQEKGDTEGESEIPTYDEAKEELKGYLKSQKEMAELEKLIDGYRKAADITIHL